MCLGFRFGSVTGRSLHACDTHKSLVMTVTESGLRDGSVPYANCGYLSLVTHFILEENEESLIALVSTKLRFFKKN